MKRKEIHILGIQKGRDKQISLGKYREECISETIDRKIHKCQNKNRVCQSWIYDNSSTLQYLISCGSTGESNDIVRRQKSSVPVLQSKMWDFKEEETITGTRCTALQDWLKDLPL